MDVNAAREELSRIKSGKQTWDDNRIAALNNIVDAQDPQKLMEKQRAAQMEAIKPAVESLNAQIPEIKSKYDLTRSQLQAQQPSLEQRYSNLLDEIKGRQTSDVNAQTRVTSGELGKRGITGSSTLAQQEIQNAVQPINTQYAKLSADTQLSREDALRQLSDSIANLTPQQTADERAIANAIAQLQAGAGQTGIQQGLSLYSDNMARAIQEQQLAEQKRQNDISDSLKNMQVNKPQLQPISIGQNSTALVNPYTGAIVNTINGLRSVSGGATSGSNPLFIQQNGQSVPRYSLVG